MKSTEEWAAELTPSTIPHELEHVMVTRGQIKQIQLDAMKEGARRAAKITNDTQGEGSVWDLGCRHSRDAILTTAEQWTEKDL